MLSDAVTSQPLLNLKNLNLVENELSQKHK